MLGAELRLRAGAPRSIAQLAFQSSGCGVSRWQEANKEISPSGPHFRDYHLLLDEQAEELFDMTDQIAERARKLGGVALRSISDIARHQRLQDNDSPCVSPQDMLAELAADNFELTRSLRHSHEVCDRHNDVATASLIEN